MAVLAAGKPTAERPLDAPGDAAWFSGLYELTFNAAYRYACVLTRDADLACDLVSDVFVRAWMRRDTLRAVEKPTAWILTATRNRVMDEFRVRKTVAHLDEVAEPLDQSSDGVLRELTDAQRARIHEAIARLTPEQQRVVMLRFFQQMPHEQVARALGRTPNAVRQTQFRALARLRQILESADA